MKNFYTIALVVSTILTIVAIVVVAVLGLNLGVDFVGGSVMEVEFSDDRPNIDDFKLFLNQDFPEREFVVTLSGTNGFIIRTEVLSEDEHQDMLGSLVNNFSNDNLTEKRFDSIGPVIGRELREKSTTAAVIVIVAIILYIAVVFRKISRVLSSWAMGVAAITAMLHDIIIPIGIFSILGHFYGVEISAIFVAAILTILGYSVSDTVVVFDRIRENVIKGNLKDGFGSVIHKSVMQTLTRSLNTSLTTLLSLIAIYFFGGESVRFFSLALIIGIFLGAYSSLFVATPLVYWWYRINR